MAGVVVTFTVTSGGGVVTDGSIATNPDGTARVGSWTLGTTPGLNTLMASVNGLPSVTFGAVGYLPPVPACVPAGSIHDFGTTTNGDLGGAGLPVRRVSDYLPTTLSEDGAYVFKLSATLDANLYLGTPIFLQ